MKLFSVLFGVLFGVSLGIAYFNPYLPPPGPPLSAPRSPPPSYSAPYAPPGGYQSSHPANPPIPPLDPKLKNFPLDLDLADFASRNPFPKAHCFFPVNGRKDIVEYMSDQQEGRYVFPTGSCQMEEEKCSLGYRKGRLPGMKKTEPPMYTGTGESSYAGLAVIPYKYVDDIDFSTCMPTWTGYVDDNNLYIRPYEPPKRNYSKQSCYHPVRPSYANEKPKTIFCDSEKCQMDGEQYCEHKTGQCYKNGYPLKTKMGKSVLNYEKLSSINWDFCADETGTLIPEDGGPPYEDRFQAGCSYRVTAPNYHEKQYAGNINFLIHCDENRCAHQELNFDMKRKEYLVGNTWSNQSYTKTPPFGEFLTIDWQCLDATKVRDYNKKLLCYAISSDEQNPDCRLCYENKKYIYQGCRYPYDELGRRADIPEGLREFDLTKELERMAMQKSDLNQNYEISGELGMWIESFRSAIIGGGAGDELTAHRMAKIVAEFNDIPVPTDKDAAKLKRQMAPFITPWMQQSMDNWRKSEREHLCNVCQSASKESRLREPVYREACAVCRNAAKP